MNFSCDKSLEFKNAVKFAPSELLFKFLVLGDYGVGKLYYFLPSIPKKKNILFILYSYR